MKKIIIGVLLLGLCFGANASISEDLDNAKVYTGYEFISLVADDVPAYAGVTPSALVWYANNIQGYSIIAIEGFEVSTGSIPTTISAQAVYPDGTNVSVSAQTITAGTDLTDIKSPWYKFTLPAYSVTRNVSFIFGIAE